MTRRLRIGIDAHAIGEHKTGNERFIANVIPALRERCDHELVLYFTHEPAARSWPRSAGTSVRVLRPANPLIRIPAVLPWHAARDHLDVLFVQYTGPPICPCPVVTVVHDVAFAVHPEFFSPRERLWMGRTIPATMRRAAGIVTVSEFSRDEIARVYGIPPSLVDVAYDGLDPRFAAASAHPSPVEPPFFLAVGNLQPRKNLATLVRAYGRLLERHPDVAERLVIVGQEWFRAEDLYRETEPLVRSGRVAFTGYVGDDDLAGLMAGATAFAYPSTYEGFGLPVIEAMSMGAPTLVSDIAVMREVAADAALRVAATDVDAWADALHRVATDAELRRSLTERGRARAPRFSWGACAEQVLRVLERAATRGRRSRGAAP